MGFDDFRPHGTSRRSFVRSLTGLAAGLTGLGTSAVALSACTTTKEVTVNLDDEGSAFGFRVVEFGRENLEDGGAIDANADLAALVEELPSLPTGDLSATAQTAQRKPVALRADALRISDGVDVVSVGVDDDGFFDVPAREDVGWYQFGPEPGASGSSVLAAHITLDGIDGAFRHLADFAAGDIITVVFDDDSEADFEVQALAQYDKEVLPLDRLFDRSGPARLILITCGGSFNPQVDSFEDNLIVYGTPV